MAETKRNINLANYDGFGWFYDQFFGSRYHGPVLGVLDRLLFPRLPPRARILDLCCGTGHLTKPMADRGFRLTGIDASADMLSFARRNVPTAELVQADARAFDLPPVFDAAVSTFDSLNHILSLDELEMVFHNVRRALRSPGVFVFDLNAELTYQTEWNKSAVVVNEESAYFIRGGYDDGEKLGMTEITAFRRLDGWTRSDLRFLQRYHSPEDVTRALADSGFGAVVCYDARQDLGMAGDLAKGRIFFEAWTCPHA